MFKFDYNITVICFKCHGPIDWTPKGRYRQIPGGKPYMCSNCYNKIPTVGEWAQGFLKRLDAFEEKSKKSKIVIGNVR